MGQKPRAFKVHKHLSQRGENPYFSLEEMGHIFEKSHEYNARLKQRHSSKECLSYYINIEKDWVKEFVKCLNIDRTNQNE